MIALKIRVLRQKKTTGGAPNPPPTLFRVKGKNGAFVISVLTASTVRSVKKEIS